MLLEGAAGLADVGPRGARAERRGPKRFVLEAVGAGLEAEDAGCKARAVGSLSPRHSDESLEMALTVEEVVSPTVCDSRP